MGSHNSVLSVLVILNYVFLLITIFENDRLALADVISNVKNNIKAVCVLIHLPCLGRYKLNKKNNY